MKHNLNDTKLPPCTLAGFYVTITVLQSGDDSTEHATRAF
jgi:hypothetical protein